MCECGAALQFHCAVSTIVSAGWRSSHTFYYRGRSPYRVANNEGERERGREECRGIQMIFSPFMPRGFVHCSTPSHFILLAQDTTLNLVLNTCEDTEEEGEVFAVTELFSSWLLACPMGVPAAQRLEKAKSVDSLQWWEF